MARAEFDMDKYTEVMGTYGEALMLLARVRKMGFAVVAFMPEELCGASQRDVENKLLEAGYDVIDELATEPDPFLIQRGA